MHTSKYEYQIVLAFYSGVEYDAFLDSDLNVILGLLVQGTAVVQE